STAIGIEALTVRPARRPRYTVDAPNSNPNSTPITIAFAVNSAGDCVARMYGWNAGGGAVIAMAGILTWCFCYNPLLPCENSEQSRTDDVDGDLDAQARATEPRSGVRAHDEPPVGVPALPQHARRCGRENDLLAGARRAVSSQRCADQERPRVLRRVRRPRRRLLRAGSEAPPPADSRPRPQAARGDHGRRQSRPRARRLSRLSAGGFPDHRALRQPEREGRPEVARRRANLRHP